MATLTDDDIDELLGDDEPAQSTNGFVYDEALEEKAYARALMSPDELAELKTTISKYGFMAIETVRNYCAMNTVKPTQEMRGETIVLDPELIIQIDIQINYQVFIAGDHVYTRNELCKHYPFDLLQTTPEKIFIQQEVGQFEKPNSEEKFEYVTRDVGSGDFVLLEDLNKKRSSGKRPTRVALTKIYIGKENWEDFLTIANLSRAFRKIVAPHALEGGPQMLLNMFGCKNSLRAIE